MRRQLFWFPFLLLIIFAASCGLDREATQQGQAEPDATGSATPDPAAPEPTTSSSSASGITLPEVDLPEIKVPAGAVATAQAAVKQAGAAAGTAVQQAGTAVNQAGDLAGTAAAVATEQGGAALATVQAIPTPDLTQLTKRLAAARPDENGQLSVTLNESELNQLLQLRYLVMSAEPDLRDATVHFQSGVIVVSGNVPLLLPVGITLSLRPVVADGHFQLEIIEAAVGRIDAPEVVLGFAGDLVSSALDDVLRRLPEGFELQSITVDQGLLTISGRVNN